MKKGKRIVSLALSLVMVMGVLVTGNLPEKVQAASTYYEKESNNNRNEANKIEVNQKVIGNVDDDDDEDWYVFTLPEDGVFTIDMEQVTNASSECEVDMYDASLNWQTGCDPSSSFHSKRFNYGKGTTFYIRINCYYSDGDYTFTINFKETKGKWEIEDNNSKNRADKLSGKMKGTILGEDDEDWFKYTAPANGYVDFKFINEDGIVTSDGWYFTVYDKNLTELASWNIETDSTLGAFTVNKKTVLYIKISNQYSYASMTDNLYSITPGFKATDYVEKEDNNSFKKATKIQANKSYVGVRNYEDDEDYYKFVAPANGTYKVSFTVEAEVSNGYDVVLYGPTKKEIKTLSDLTDDSSAKIKMKKGKTYYIHVNRHSTYSYSWLAKYKVKVTKVK